MWYHVMYVHMLASLRIWSWPLHLWIRWMQCPSSFRPHKIKCNWNLKHVEMCSNMFEQRCFGPRSRERCNGRCHRTQRNPASHLHPDTSWHIMTYPAWRALRHCRIPHVHSPKFRMVPSCSVRLDLVFGEFPRQTSGGSVRKNHHDHHPIIIQSGPIIPAISWYQLWMRTLDDSCEVIVPLSLSFAILGRWMMSKVWKKRKEFGVMLLYDNVTTSHGQTQRHVFAFSNGLSYWVNWVNGFSFALALALVFTSRLKPWAQRDVKTRRKKCHPRRADLAVIAIVVIGFLLSQWKTGTGHHWLIMYYIIWNIYILYHIYDICII